MVHCFMGISRSTSFVVAYLMKKLGMSAESALAVVKARRPCVKPNESFLRQLQKYEGALKAPAGSRQISDFLVKRTDATSVQIPPSQKIDMVPKNERNIKHWFDPTSSSSSSLSSSRRPVDSVKASSLGDKKRDRGESRRTLSTSNCTTTWSCSACTFMNHADLSLCEVCEQPNNSKCVKA
jgi:Dual specificity phosphatase, catalytic domain